MPKHPPERYEPGELERTRLNLGDLSPEEARKMAQMFDGEIGIERTTPEMEEKYRRLQMLNRRKSDPPPFTTAWREHGQAAAATQEAKAEVRTVSRRPGLYDRIRNNFWAASKDHGIMPLRQAIGTLFAFVIPLQERLHPQFIIKGDENFYYSMERLVLAVRSLMSINRREEVPSLKDPHSLQILAVLRDWDIETIHQELTVLQRSPRRQPLNASEKLCRALYRPFLQLIELDVSEHILPVLKRLFDLDLMAYPTDSREAERIKLIGRTLKHELFHLFTDIRRRCAPLLVKLADLPYAPYPELFAYFRPRLLEFLSLREEELLEREPEELFRPGEEDEAVDEIEDEQEHEETEDQPEEPKLPEETEHALEFLTKLFPLSGFEKLTTFPDLFSYFKPLVSFPKNTDLFHPQNPVHQIAVLLALLQEFLYGFRQIIFGEITDNEGNAREIQGEIDRHLLEWPRLLDELVCGRLLTELVDYCRQIERSPEYRSSDAGIKQEHQILLRIRRGLMPHLEVATIRGSSLPEDRNLPQLHTTVSGFSRLLKESLRLDPEAAKPGLRNASAPFHFEIETFITLRFRRYLRKKGLPQDNRHLVQHVALLLDLLDYLINSPQSHLYEKAAFPLYRQEKGHREIPIYSVPGMETIRIIEGNDVELTPPEEFLDEEAAKKDRVSGLLRFTEYENAIKDAVNTYHSAGTPVSVATLSIPELRILEPEARDDKLRVIGHSVRGEIREYSDLPYRMQDDSIPIILPETGAENAIRFCRRLIGAILDKLPQTGLHVGLVTYHPTWSAGKLIRTASRTASEAERRRPPVLLMYRESDADFEEYPLETETET